MGRLSVLILAFALLAGPAAAACNIVAALTIPRFEPEPGNWPRPGSGETYHLHPEIWLDIETRRRLGDWERARLTLPPGTTHHHIVPPVTDRYPQRLSERSHRIIGTGLNPTLPRSVTVQVALQGIGCVADRELRFRYRCWVDPGRQFTGYSRHYRHDWQTLTPLGTGRVAPRNFSVTVACPMAG